MCGIVGVIGDNASYILGNALRSLQNRGRDGYGYTDLYAIVKRPGHVPQTLPANLISNCIIGHLRYSTSKTKHPSQSNLQPYLSENHLSKFALVHNGNIPGSDYDPDTLELVKYLETTHAYSWNELLFKFMSRFQGVYCVIILTPDGLYAMRDSYGVRPLCILTRRGNTIISSESIPKTRFVKHIRAGEITFIDTLQRITVIKPGSIARKFCSFETFYFMKPDSVMNGNVIVYDRRYALGRVMGLQEKHTAKDIDAVIAIPRTSLPAGKGFSLASGIPYKRWLKKRLNAGRTFILPTNDKRIEECKRKFTFNPKLKGKRIILIDDSIVRGNTIKTIIDLLKKTGVKQIHLRVTAPIITNTCRWGIDLPTEHELIGHGKSTEQIRKELGIDSLVYIDVKDFLNSVGSGHCTSCFTGKELF